MPSSPEEIHEEMNPRCPHCYERDCAAAYSRNVPADCRMYAEEQREFSESDSNIHMRADQ